MALEALTILHFPQLVFDASCHCLGRAKVEFKAKADAKDALKTMEKFKWRGRTLHIHEGESRNVRFLKTGSVAPR
jgi:RNA recognition motif-containing protein